MTEKRFTMVEFSNGNWGVKDNNTEYEYPSPIDLLDLLNEQQTIINKLREENKKLKEINKDKEQDVLHLYKKNEKLREIIKKGVNNE